MSEQRSSLQSAKKRFQTSEYIQIFAVEQTISGTSKSQFESSQLDSIPSDDSYHGDEDIQPRYFFLLTFTIEAS